jgi:hypothetical protein
MANRSTAEIMEDIRRAAGKARSTQSETQPETAEPVQKKKSGGGFLRKFVSDYVIDLGDNDTQVTPEGMPNLTGTGDGYAEIPSFDVADNPNDLSQKPFEEIYAEATGRRIYLQRGRACNNAAIARTGITAFEL